MLKFSNHLKFVICGLIGGTFHCIKFCFGEMPEKIKNHVVTLENYQCYQKATSGSAGYDLFVRVLTETYLTVSKKLVSKIHSRSTLLICSIETEAGVVDSHYRGNIKFVLHNLSNKKVKFRIGDKIALVIFGKNAVPILEDVEEFCDTTERV